MCGHCYQRIPQIRQQAEQARAKITQSERVSVCGTDGVGWGGVGGVYSLRYICRYVRFHGK